MFTFANGQGNSLGGVGSSEAGGEDDCGNGHAPVLGTVSRASVVVAGRWRRRYKSLGMQRNRI